MKKYREKYTGVLSEELMEQLADDRLQDELRSGVQTIQYQINTLMTTNGQSPFVTLFLNPDKSHPYAK
ncbi:anaerobic ribonucleoside-triphosphate reductase, partial [Bittarella massiliensis (ex Durand et al. 2017)]